MTPRIPASQLILKKLKVRQGTILIKLYFSVTKEEQERRFERRKTDELRQWKLSEVDVQAQERWDDFTNVKHEMLKKTHTTHAPWTIIRSNDKHLARLNVMKVILNSVPYQRSSIEVDFIPDPSVGYCQVDQHLPNLGHKIGLCLSSGTRNLMPFCK